MTKTHPFKSKSNTTILMALLKAILPHVTVACLSVCISSVTLVHPAKTVERNEVPFGKYTRVFPSDIVLDRAPFTEGEVCGSEPPVCMLPIAKLLYPGLSFTFFYSLCLNVV